MKCKDSEIQRSSSRRRSASPAPPGPLVLQPGSTKPRPSLATDRLHLHNGRSLRQTAHDVGRYNAQNMWPGMEERFCVLFQKNKANLVYCSSIEAAEEDLRRDFPDSRFDMAQTWPHLAFRSGPCTTWNDGTEVGQMRLPKPSLFIAITGPHLSHL
ncbi:hypothetical protein SRHO_G00135110 [Serrasalmus rhombeus]